MPPDNRYIHAIMDGLLADPAVALAYEADATFHAWIITTAQALAALVPAMAQTAECALAEWKAATDRLAAGQTASGVFATKLDENGDPIPGTTVLVSGDARARAAIAASGVALERGEWQMDTPGLGGVPTPKPIPSPEVAESVGRALARRASLPPNQEPPT